MNPRFQADADLNRHIVLAAKRREPMVDFRTAQDARLSGLSDDDVLAFAASEGRILVSHDRQTMPQHFGEFIQRQTSPGLLIVSQHLPVSAAADELLLIWFASKAEEWINQVASIPL